MPAPPPSAIAALTVHRHRLDLAAVDLGGRVLTVRTAPNPPADGALDVAHVQRWLVAALGDLGEGVRLEAIVPFAHGRTVALVDGRGLVAPMPHGLAGEDGILDLLATVDEATRSRARWFVGHAQFWAMTLAGGGVVGEASSLGEASGLFEPYGGRPSAALRALGWHGYLPPLRRPHEVLGRIARAVADAADLPRDLPVLVGASILAARHGRLLAKRLQRASLIVADAEGCVVLDAQGRAADVVLALDGRPVARHRVVDPGPPVPAVAEAPAAALRGALVLERALDRLGAAGPVVVQGDLVDDVPTLRVLAALLAPRLRAVFVERTPAAPAQAAALLLALRHGRPAPRLMLERIDPQPVAGLDELRADWRARAGD